MSTRIPHSQHGGAHSDAPSALDALLVAESEAQRALQDADAAAATVRAAAREQINTIRRDAAAELDDALAASKQAHAAQLAEQLAACTQDAAQRIRRYHAVAGATVERLAQSVVDRLVGSAT